MQIIIDTDTQDLDAALELVRAAYRERAGAGAGGDRVVDPWVEFPLAAPWVAGIREVDALAVVWRICRTPETFVTLAELSEFLAPRLDPSERLEVGRAALAELARQGREVGGRGRLPFETRDGADPAYRADRSLADALRKEVRRSPLHRQLAQRYPGVDG